jgi:hypothetical protein
LLWASVLLIRVKLAERDLRNGPPPLVPQLLSRAALASGTAGAMVRW